MRVCVAVFRSRTQVMAFVDYMQNVGVVSSVVPTPKEAKIGCGVSAKFPLKSLNVARAVITKYRLTAFYGFFMVTKNANTTTTVRI